MRKEGGSLYHRRNLKFDTYVIHVEKRLRTWRRIFHDQSGVCRIRKRKISFIVLMNREGIWGRRIEKSQGILLPRSDGRKMLGGVDKIIMDEQILCRKSAKRNGPVKGSVEIAFGDDRLTLICF